MDDYAFGKKLELARDAMSAASDLAEQQYCAGFSSGLKRAHHGAEGVSDDDHNEWLRGDGPMCEGYRDGFKGKRFPKSITGRLRTRRWYTVGSGV